MPRKPKPAEPAFVVEHATKTDHLGLTKREAFAAVVTMGIFAGPAGQVILDSHDASALQGVADVAFHMADMMVSRGAA